MFLKSGMGIRMLLMFLFLAAVAAYLWFEFQNGRLAFHGSPAGQ
jgi:hypothetical protein